MKFISWNVNGLRACVKPKTGNDDPKYDSKGFEAYFKALDADVFCLQETKMQEGQLDLQFEGYQSYWNYAEKKGYSGTAVYTRIHPLHVTYGIGIDLHDHEGRVITLEFPEFYFITCYTPNSGETPAPPTKNMPKRLEYRMEWEADFQAYLRKLDEKKPIILCGDLNVAHKEIDVSNPDKHRKNHDAGFTDQEREKIDLFLKSGFTDTFRQLYPEQVTYSFWTYRGFCRPKNLGWRLDYFIISNRLTDRLKDSLIHTEIMGSDHCPVELDLK